MERLARLGLTPALAARFAPHLAEGLVPARVAVQHRGTYELLTEERDLLGEVSGRFRHRATGAGDFPVVGDWVAARPIPGEERGIVEQVLPRQTRLSRTDPSEAEQVLAANVDTVFICSSADPERLALPDANLRRLERYLAMVHDSGAGPAILLTKCDLAVAIADDVAALASLGVPVHPISSFTRFGFDALETYLTSDRTAVLVGSSGVGKSTLINTLVGEARLSTREVRDDLTGRHGSVRRELVAIPTGGVLIDTPGLRELELWGAGLAETFPEIEALAGSCRFGDCSHESEPGCGIRGAIADGRLDAARFESYRRLAREIEHLEKKGRQAALAARRKDRRGRSARPH